MDCIKIPRGGCVVVVGDIHEHEEQFDALIERVKPSKKRMLVSVGDIYEKGFGLKAAESITSKFMELVNKGHAMVVRGNHEFKCIHRAKKNNKITKQLEWFEKQPISIPFEFSNNTRLIVLHGGVTPKHTWEDLKTDIYISYLRNVDKNGNYIKLCKKIKNGLLVLEDSVKGGRPWHEVYNGRFGYIASGHASIKEGIPKFYNYSCNLDTAVFHTGKLTAQVFSDQGREELIIVEGTPKYPDLDIMYKLMANGRI